MRSMYNHTESPEKNPNPSNARCLVLPESSIHFLIFHRRFEKSGIQCIYVKSTVGQILSYHCQFIILLFCIYDLEVHWKRT